MSIFIYVRGQSTPSIFRSPCGDRYSIREQGASSVRDGTVVDFDVCGDLDFARGSLRLNSVLCPVISCGGEEATR
jgi:hypothetical protein